MVTDTQTDKDKSGSHCTDQRRQSPTFKSWLLDLHNCHIHNAPTDTNKLLLVSLSIVLCLKRRRVKRNRLWVTSWWLRRERQGAYLHLRRELQTEDVQSFQNFTRFVPKQFQQLGARRLHGKPRPLLHHML